MRRLPPATRGLIAPIVLLAVAAHQYYRVHTADWNSWRGGGFGMYAGFHPEHAEIWLWREGEPALRIERRPAEPDTLGVQDCFVRANRRCLREAVERMRNREAVRTIQIWELSFDPATRVLGRRMLVEWSADE